MTALARGLIDKYISELRAGQRRELDTKRLEKLFKLPLKVTVTRNSKKDYTMCGFAYRVTLQNTQTGYKFTTSYNDSIINSRAGLKPDINDIISCLLADRSCYLSAPNFSDFCAEFGYEEYTESRYTGNIILNRQARRAFEGCRNTAERLETLLNNEQLEYLEEVYQDY